MITCPVRFNDAIRIVSITNAAQLYVNDLPVTLPCLIKAGDKIAGLRVTKHAATNFLERNMNVVQIENALRGGTKYLDTTNNTIVHVIGERGKGGYSIVTNLAQDTLVTVENFVQKLSDTRFKLLQ